MSAGQKIMSTSRSVNEPPCQFLLLSFFDMFVLNYRYDWIQRYLFIIKSLENNIMLYLCMKKAASVNYCKKLAFNC